MKIDLTFLIEKLCTASRTGVCLIMLTEIALAGQYAVVRDDDQFVKSKSVNFSLVYLKNVPSAEVLFPEAINCRLVMVNSQEILAEAKAKESLKKTSFVKNSAYVKQNYEIDLPDGIGGDIIVHLAGVSVPAFLVQAADFQEKPPSLLKEKEYQTIDSLYSLYQPYVRKLSAYEPMYFLLGADPKESKFQISFKYRLFNQEAPLAKNHPWLTGFHLAYTQTSFWDLVSDSAPFNDTSYKPEFFWQSENLISENMGLLQGVFFQGGYQHHSNGNAGDFSRSTNYLYLFPSFVFYDRESSFGLAISPKVWTYIYNDADTNHDLDEYQGYFEIQAKAGFAESIVFDAKYRWASEGYSAEFDVSYPLHKFFNSAVEFYLYGQYSYVLAESLLHYSERVEAFRIGLAVVR